MFKIHCLRCVHSPSLFKFNPFLKLGKLLTFQYPERNEFSEIIKKKEKAKEQGISEITLTTLIFYVNIFIILQFFIHYPKDKSCVWINIILTATWIRIKFSSAVHTCGFMEICITWNSPNCMVRTLEKTHLPEKVHAWCSLLLRELTSAFHFSFWSKH